MANPEWTDPQDWDVRPRTFRSAMTAARFSIRAPKLNSPGAVGFDDIARDSDTRRMAETGTGSVRSTGSAGLKGLAHD